MNRSALLPCSCDDAFGVVRDVLRYPEFLPACESVEIVEETADETVARMAVAARGFSEALTTRNRYTAPNRVDISLVEGPFRSLEGAWRFTALGDAGCKVELEIEFDIGGLLGRMLGKLAEGAADRMVDAFCNRMRAGG